MPTTTERETTRLRRNDKTCDATHAVLIASATPILYPMVSKSKVSPCFEDVLFLT
jgi:hypothetical protein